MALSLDVIFVPHGAEYEAVKAARLPISVVAIPMGLTAVGAALEQWRSHSLNYAPSQPRVLVMGLAGSLSPNLNPGDAVLCHTCISPEGEPQAGDRHLLDQLQRLYEEQGQPLPRYSAYSSDRLIEQAQAKQQLAQDTGAAVVEMEGWAIWQQYPQVAMIRVISDDCCHDLPDLSQAIGHEGTINPLALTTAFLRQPRAALRLIGGSLRGLHQLKRMARLLHPHLSAAVDNVVS